MRIGLLGFGTVGKGVFELTGARKDMQVVKVLCRKDRTVPGVEVTHDFQDILRDDSIDTIVETIGGLHPAKEYVMAALEAGKNVVTANKAMMAHFYDEILPLRKRRACSCAAPPPSAAASAGSASWKEYAGSKPSVRWAAL